MSDTPQAEVIITMVAAGEWIGGVHLDDELVVEAKGTNPSWVRDRLNDAMATHLVETRRELAALKASMRTEIATRDEELCNVVWAAGGAVSYERPTGRQLFWSASDWAFTRSEKAGVRTLLATPKVGGIPTPIRSHVNTTHKEIAVPGTAS